MSPILRGIFGKGSGRRGIQKDPGAPRANPSGLTPSHKANLDGMVRLAKGYADLVQALMTAWKRNNSHDEIVKRLQWVVKVMRERSSMVGLNQLSEVLKEMDALVTAVHEKRLPITKEFVSLASEFGDFIEEAVRNSRLPKKMSRKVEGWHDRYKALMLGAEQMTADSGGGAKSPPKHGTATQRTTEPTAKPVKPREMWPDNLAVAAAAARINELEDKLETLQEKHQKLVARSEHVAAARDPDDKGQRHVKGGNLSSESYVEDLEKLLFLKRGRRPGKGPRKAR